MLRSKKIKGVIWNNGLGKQDVQNLYTRIIGAVSDTDMSVVAAWQSRACGLVHVFEYHRLQAIIIIYAYTVTNIHRNDYIGYVASETKTKPIRHSTKLNAPSDFTLQPLTWHPIRLIFWTTTYQSMDLFNFPSIYALLICQVGPTWVSLTIAYYNCHSGDQTLGCSLSL